MCRPHIRQNQSQRSYSSPIFDCYFIPFITFNQAQLTTTQNRHAKRPTSAHPPSTQTYPFFSWEGPPPRPFSISGVASMAAVQRGPVQVPRRVPTNLQLRTQNQYVLTWFGRLVYAACQGRFHAVDFNPGPRKLTSHRITPLAQDQPGAGSSGSVLNLSEGVGYVGSNEI